MADSKTKSGNNPDNISELKIKQIEDEVASSYLLVDIGANLTNSKYSRDLDSVVERAKDAGLFDRFSNIYNVLTWFALQVLRK